MELQFQTNVLDWTANAAHGPVGVRGVNQFKLAVSVYGFLTLVARLGGPGATLVSEFPDVFVPISL